MLMRSIYLMALILALPLTANAADIKLDTLDKKFSYAFGVDFINRMKQQDVPVDLDALVQGLTDASKGGKTMLSDAEMTQVKKDFQQQAQKKHKEKQAALAAKNLEEGETFLKANATKEGVITTKSGLQYKVLKAGEGDSPRADDTVTTHYEGRLVNGEVFDSSYKRNQPSTFPVKGVIKGWTEALQLMKPGAKWQLFIPANLAYGASKRGAQIEPNSTLIFDIELMSVEKKK